MLNTMALTPRQREVLDFIRQAELQYGASPTTREIQSHFGFASQTAAVDHIRALERKGALVRTPGWSRVVTTRPPRRQIVHVPVFGSLPAGIPELVEHEPDGFVAVDLTTIGLSKDAQLFGTRVRGDSMLGAHILDGDLAVFHVREPQSGEFVAALIDGETTLKRYVQRRNKLYLHAENPRYPDLIPARELVIQGVLVHLQRAI